MGIKNAFNLNTLPKNNTKDNTLMLQDLLNSQLYKRKSENLLRFGFKFDSDVASEYDKLQQLLFSEYHIRNKSMLTIMNDYQIPSSKTIHCIFKIVNVYSRSASDASKLALEEGRAGRSVNDKSYMKCGWHTTWDGRSVYLRSSYEFDYAAILDNNRTDYMVEHLKIKYFDTQTETYRMAIPDFYLPDTKTIVEVKGSFWYNEINMFDKFLQYHRMGFIPKLILNHEECEIRGFDGI